MSPRTKPAGRSAPSLATSRRKRKSASPSPRASVERSERSANLAGVEEPIEPARACSISSRDRRQRQASADDRRADRRRPPTAILSVNNIEVIYDHVILVLKGVSLDGAAGRHRRAARRQRRRQDHDAQGDLQPAALRARRGHQRLDRVRRRARCRRCSPNELVRRGCIQVMEGRHCFGHLTVEENLLTGAFTRRDGAAAIRADLEKVYGYFPRLRERRKSLAGYTSGGEQQMCAIGRALMSRPKMILLDEPSMGLAPQIVEEIFEIVKSLNESEGVSFLLAEQNTNMALKYADLRLHPGERPRRARRRGQGAARERGRQGILSRRRRGQAQIVPRREALQAPQALAGVTVRGRPWPITTTPSKPAIRKRASAICSRVCRGSSRPR